MRVEMRLLAEACETIFKQLRDMDISRVEMDVDYYWDISADERYDPTNSPIDLTLGMLSDDLEQLTKIAAGQSEIGASGFKYLASMLRAVADRPSTWQLD